MNLEIEILKKNTWKLVLYHLVKNLLDTSGFIHKIQG